MKPRAMPWLEYLESILDEDENGCLVPRLATNKKGYVPLSVGGRAGPKVRAHRWYWEQHYGTVPSELQVLHHCDNRACCNLEHLYVGTAQDNTDDMYARGRARNQYGSHGFNPKRASNVL